MGFDKCFELTKYKLKSPIKEPEMPNSDLRSLPEPLAHPDSAHVSLIYIPQLSYSIHYAPTISCVLSMSSNSEIRTPARALINTSGKFLSSAIEFIKTTTFAFSFHIYCFAPNC